MTAVIVGVGPADWDHGADLFVALGRRLPASLPLRWIGPAARPWRALIAHDVVASGCADRLTWDPEGDVSTIGVDDVVVLTWRRPDPAVLDDVRGSAPGRLVLGFESCGAGDVPFPDVGGLAAAVQRSVGVVP